MQPLEGSFLVTKDDLIFEVKGILHPETRVIAYLRYVPSEKGERVAPGGRRYRKVYDLEARERYLKEKFPQYLWYDAIHGRWMQTVDWNDVSYVLEPPEALREMRDLGQHLRGLESDSLALVKHIVERADIKWDSIGITGSQLLGLSIPDSDIDVVVYGLEAGRRVYSIMRSFFANRIVERYSGLRLYEHVDFRWGGVNLDSTVLAEIEEKKYLQGIFREREFYIRLVKLPSDLDYRYGDRIYGPSTSRTAICRITDDSDSIFTPCEYDVDCESDPSLEKIISFRGRFAEQAHVGTFLRVRGSVENVRDLNSGREYRQFILGEKDTDYMVPLEKNLIE